MIKRSLKITIIYIVLDMDTTMQFNVTIGSTLGDNVFSTTSNDMECDGKIISRGDKFITYLKKKWTHTDICVIFIQ